MSTTTTALLSPVHGGLDAPVNRHALRHQVNLDKWTLLPSIAVSEVDRTTLHRIADGTLSPLTGPMSRADCESVLERAAIERGGKLWAWGIPVVLPINGEEFEKCRAGRKVALVSNGIIFGTLTVAETYTFDKPRFAKCVYGTERMDHPGARLWTEDSRTKLVAGEIELLPFVDRRPFAERVMSPAQTRALIAKERWEQSVAFQTRNPLHRAHEYALVYGAEAILRETGRRTGVVLNPLVGQLKDDDVPAATRMKTYASLIDGRHLGEGDMDEALWREKGQDLRAQTRLIGLDMRMYYGGPREAIMHAIYRQNLGFTHFIVGRKHADAPYDDGTAIWGDFDAQEIFQRLSGALSIKPVNVGFAAFFEELGRVGLVADNKGKTVVTISGTKVREQLDSGEMPDPRIMRPSTAQVLVEYYAAKRAAEAKTAAAAAARATARAAVECAASDQAGKAGE